MAPYIFLSVSSEKKQMKAKDKMNSEYSIMSFNNKIFFKSREVKLFVLKILMEIALK